MEGGVAEKTGANPTLLERGAESDHANRSARPAIFNAAAAAANIADRALRRASDFVTPQTTGSASVRGDPWLLYVCAIVGSALAMKVWLIFSGDAMMTNSDGASRLFVAIDRFGDTDYFRELSTWLSVPMPVPQIYYTLLYALDQASGGAAPVTITALLMNATFYAAAVLVLALAARRIGGAAAGAIFATLAVTAQSPNFISMTAAVEPLAFLFFSAGLWFTLAALTAPRPFLLAMAGAVALTLATAFRLEYFVLYPIFSLLLYSRLGFRRCAVFTATALSYAFLYQGAGYAFGDITPYAELSSYYDRSSLSLERFFRSALYAIGIEGVWGRYALAFLSIMACYALLTRQHRWLGVLAIGAIGFIVLGALAGRFGAGQPRYATLAMLLLALPAATVVARNARLSTGLSVILFAVAGVYSLVALDKVLALRAASPPVQVKHIAERLVSRIEAGDAAFFDHSSGYYDYAMAIAAMTRSRAPAYAYLTRCCVSEAAADRLGADEVRRLTGDKAIVTPALTTDDKLLSFQIWAHGFIERRRPKYFVLERNRRSRSLEEARNWPRALSSTIWPFATRVSDDRKALNVKLEYANVEFALIPVAQNGWYTLYEARY